MEWGLVMQWSHHTLAEWRELDGDDQAYLVALYRASHQMEAVVAYSQQQEAENKRAAMSNQP